MIRSRDPLTWFVTGCSSGFGRALALALLDRGDRVAGTARAVATLAELTEAGKGAFVPIELDLACSESPVRAASEAAAALGRIDVLVNNAGYGYLAAVEEGEADEISTLFRTNVFGLFQLTRSVLPGMRRRGAGHIVNISSIAGIVGSPGAAYYAASKFAVEGFSEALCKEVEPLGIRVTVVAPGAFRTDWAGRSLRQSVRSIDAYAETAGRRRREIAASDGRRPGDPERAVQAIITAVEADAPPLHLVLGRGALQSARAKIAALSAELDLWEDVSESTDYPEAVA